jgi:methionyl-tRNA formyltransferase
MMPPRRVVVFGYGDMGVRGLAVLQARGAHVVGAVTHPDDPGEARWFASLAQAAHAAGIPVLAPRHAREPGLLDRLRALEPDLIVSLYYRRLLPPAVLAVPRLAAVNLHGSLLPKYRGRAPLNWVLVNGETETGVTLHHMDAEADHGDIIAQRAVPITLEDTAPTLWQKVLAAGETLLGETYPLLAAGCAPRRAQDHAAATVVGRRRPADGLIDWSLPARAVYNLVRAVTHPFPGAFTFLDGRRVFVWAARPRPSAAPASPGSVSASADAGTPVVATGEGALELLRVQLEGGPELDGAAFLTRVLEGADAVFSATPGVVATRGRQA